MKKALLLVGSPRGKKSTSTSLANYLSRAFQGKGMETQILWILHHVSSDEKMSEITDAVKEADIIILTAPLYDDCQPYIVIKLMEAVGKKLKNLQGKVFYPIINSGFQENHHITAAAVPVYRLFADRVGFIWAGSMAIGAGEALRGASGLQLGQTGGFGKKTMKAMDRITEVLAAGNLLNDDVLELLPSVFNNKSIKKIIGKLNTLSWKSMAKKNGGGVDARPF